jgi:hypothetical protein
VVLTAAGEVFLAEARRRRRARSRLGFRSRPRSGHDAASRKLVLTAHVMTSVGWFGAVVASLALTVTALTADQSTAWRAAYPAMDVVTRSPIVPLAAGSLLTGLMSSLGSSRDSSATTG